MSEHQLFPITAQLFQDDSGRVVMLGLRTEHPVSFIRDPFVVYGDRKRSPLMLYSTKNFAQRACSIR